MPEENERRRTFPRSERGDLPGQIAEVFGEDHQYLDLHFVCEALFGEHNRICPAMIAHVMGGYPKCDGLLWLCSDAAGYMELALEYYNEETRDRNKLPIDILRDYIDWRQDPAVKVVNPVTGQEIGSPDEQILIWFQKTEDCLERDRAYFAWKEKLVTDPQIMGGATVFPGSRLTVTHIGQMVYRGAWHSDILKDYPYLTEDDLVHASRFLHDFSDLL